MANTKGNYKVAYKVINFDGNTEKQLWVMYIEAVSAVKAIKYGAILLENQFGIEMTFSKPVAYGRDFALAHATGSEFSPNNVLTATVTH